MGMAALVVGCVGGVGYGLLVRQAAGLGAGWFCLEPCCQIHPGTW
jgi:hypothetical protein